MKRITEQEFITVVSEASDLMYRLAYGILHNETDAEDAISESVLKAWENIDNIHNVSRLKNWLLSIVVNESKNMYKKIKREVAVERIFEYLDATEVKNENSDILYILESLKMEQRIVIIMHYFNEMSVKEIAEVLHISTGTVKSRLNRARNNLKLILEERIKKNLNNNVTVKNG